MADAFAVTERMDGLAVVELADRVAGSAVTLAPTRGGMVTSFVAGGRELFYLDRATLLDPAANVRGGNPVLFPTPGKLAGDTWRWGGRSGSMKQHGFARTLPWQLVSTTTSGAARATLRLASSDATRVQFPWECAIELDHTLTRGTLRIDVRVTNQDTSPMPCGVGFHPYFLVPQADKARVAIATGATLAYDNAAKREVPFTGFDLTAPEVDLHLVDHPAPEIAMTLADGRAIVVAGSPEIHRWVVWTLAGKDFVCVEPWTCAGDALNRNDPELLVLEPGEVRALWMSVGLD